jgi:hypothetical protein
LKVEEKGFSAEVVLQKGREPACPRQTESVYAVDRFIKTQRKG